MKKHSLIEHSNTQLDYQQSHFALIINRHSLKKGVKFLLVLAAVAILFFIMPYIKSLLIGLGISFIIAYLLSPIVDWLENHGMNRAIAATLIFLVIIGALVLGIQFLTPTISQEVKSISEFIQNENPDSIIEKLQVILSDRFPALKKPEVAQNVSLKLHALLKALTQKSIDLLISFLSSFMLIITIPFITFFFLKDGRNIKKALIQLVPNRYFEMSLNLIYKSNKKLGSYIRGQLLVAFVIGVLSIFAMFILNIPYFFVIGVVAGLANMIPYFGPWVGALPGIIVAFMETGSIGSVISVIIAFAVIQLLDNIFVSPIIVSKSVDIHPLLVIIILLVGSSLAGILGMLLAIPIFAVIQVIIKEIIWSFKNYYLAG
jgi:predicted PurR-regulated permease PerM